MGELFFTGSLIKILSRVLPLPDLLSIIPISAIASTQVSEENWQSGLRLKLDTFDTGLEWRLAMVFVFNELVCSPIESYVRTV